MKLYNVVLALLCTSAVIASGGKGDGDGKSDKSDKKHTHTQKVTIETECKEIIVLEKLELLAGNNTELADKTHNNATKIAEIQSKASASASRLAALKEKLEHDCKEIEKLEKFIKLAGNSAVTDKAKNNATKIAEIAAQASKDNTALQKLESNNTLVTLCPIIDAAEKEKECEEIKKLESFVVFVGNSTAVADKTKGNSTKAAEIEAKASKDATVLANLKSNATLVSDCATIASSEAKSLETANSTSMNAAASGLLDGTALVLLIVLLATGMIML